MIKDKVLIIGGTGSLGTSMVKKLKSSYKNILLTHTRPSNNNIHQLDLEDADSIKNLASSLENLNHVIFAAGYEPKQNLKNFDIDHANRMFNIHVIGPMLLISMIKEKFLSKSSITFISSVASYKGSYDPTYAAAKGAINSLTRTLANELAPKTRVNSIAPSLINNSKVFRGMTPDFRDKHLKASILNKFLSSNECSEAILFLMSNNHITGQILHINGGQYFG